MKRVAGLLLALIMLGAICRAGGAYVVLVQTKPGVQIGNLANELGGNLIDSGIGNTYLIEITRWPATLPDNVTAIEAVETSHLPAIRGGILKSDTAESDWYKMQPAFRLINLPSALQRATGTGIIIADIDAAVDVNHPALRGHLIAGADFVNGKTTCAKLNQSSSEFLDQSSSE